ncbi:hypothetical protein [Microbacterium aurum]|jgi:hypothetical protein|uniref:hypothetical protein n=1 Tax=Microbacterium aurum TaxID=36805 RepID=UPI0012F4D96C|nr:hypothetical protein [Microbacterium aurum]MBM7826886.1 hypothetical protein [Microbacterium aurum]
MPSANRFGIRLSERAAALVADEAKWTDQSKSEVICAILDSVISSPSTKAGRRTVRVSFYDPTARRLDDVRSKAHELGTTATSLINAEIEEVLGGG